MSKSDSNFNSSKPNSKSRSEKEVYEYIPDEVSSTSKSQIEGDDTKQFKFKDIHTNDSPLQPALAYETFKHKSWKANQRQTFNKEAFIIENDQFNSLPNYIISENSISNVKENKSTSQGLFVRDTTIELFETPLERLSRLENELNELQDYINKLISSSSEDLDDRKESKQIPTFSDSSEFEVLLGDDPLSLLKEIKLLEAQVSSLNGDPRIQALFQNSDPISFKSDGFSTIKEHLDSAGLNSQTLSSDSLINKSDPSNYTIYELYSENMMKPILENGRIISLENRVSDLENKIGIHKLGFLPFGDISTALDQFSSRLSSMDHRRIDIINNKIQNLLVDLQVIHSKRNELIGSPLDDKKLNFLYDLCHRWKLLSSSIPTLVKRLQTLKSLHQEASSLNTRLKLMETQQEEMKKLLDSTRLSFNELQSSMSQSTEWAKRTTDALQRRMEEIKSSKR